MFVIETVEFPPVNPVNETYMAGKNYLIPDLLRSLLKLNQNTRNKYQKQGFSDNYSWSQQGENN